MTITCHNCGSEYPLALYLAEGVMKCPECGAAVRAETVEVKATQAGLFLDDEDVRYE